MVSEKKKRTKLISKCILCESRMASTKLSNETNKFRCFFLLPHSVNVCESDKKTIPFSAKRRICVTYLQIFGISFLARIWNRATRSNPIVSILIKRNWAHGLCRHFDANGEADISIWIFVFIFRQTISMKCGNVSIFLLPQIRKANKIDVNCVCVCVCVLVVVCGWDARVLKWFWLCILY